MAFRLFDLEKVHWNALLPLCYQFKAPMTTFPISHKSWLTPRTNSREANSPVSRALTSPRRGQATCTQTYCATREGSFFGSQFASAIYLHLKVKGRSTAIQILDWRSRLLFKVVLTKSDSRWQSRKALANRGGDFVCFQQCPYITRLTKSGLKRIVLLPSSRTTIFFKCRMVTGTRQPHLAPKTTTLFWPPPGATARVLLSFYFLFCKINHLQKLVAFKFQLKMGLFDDDGNTNKQAWNQNVLHQNMEQMTMLTCCLLPCAVFLEAEKKNRFRGPIFCIHHP